MGADHGHLAVVEPVVQLVAEDHGILQLDQVIQGVLDLGVAQVGGDDAVGGVGVQEGGTVGVHEGQDGILPGAVAQLDGLAVHGLGHGLADVAEGIPGPFAIEVQLIGIGHALQVEEVLVEEDVEDEGLQRHRVGGPLPAEEGLVHVEVAEVLVGGVVIDGLADTGQDRGVEHFVIDLEQVGSFAGLLQRRDGGEHVAPGGVDDIDFAAVLLLEVGDGLQDGVIDVGVLGGVVGVLGLVVPVDDGDVGVLQGLGQLRVIQEVGIHFALGSGVGALLGGIAAGDGGVGNGGVLNGSGFGLGCAAGDQAQAHGQDQDQGQDAFFHVRSSL